MGRKNRFKSTFINNLNPGTLRVCHATHATFSFPEKTKKGDVVLVLEVTDFGFEHSVNKLRTSGETITMASYTWL